MDTYSDTASCCNSSFLSDLHYLFWSSLHLHKSYCSWTRMTRGIVVQVGLLKMTLTLFHSLPIVESENISPFIK